MTPTPSVIEEHRQIEKELRQLRQHQETAAWQRCHPFVLRDGDKNTSYFHTKASNKRRRNRLKGLEDAHGVKQKSHEGMKSIVINYFSDLFATLRSEISIDQVGFIEEKISADMVDLLSRSYSHDEVEAALADMHPFKSPGPDGLYSLLQNVLGYCWGGFVSYSSGFSS